MRLSGNSGFESINVAVFAYQFPHRKTQDFLLQLFLSGVNSVTVFAAPRKELEHTDNKVYFADTTVFEKPIETATLCKRLDYEYVKTEHDDVERIAGVCGRKGIELGLIAGARILKKDIIQLFARGVVNFHPGSLPETSGLDSFFYMIKHQSRPGISVHFIDYRVDAGKLVFFQETKLSAEDSKAQVRENLYRTQLVALNRLLPMYLQGDIEARDIVRPTKNSPMSATEKEQVLQNFESWKARIIDRQKTVAGN